MSQPEKKSFFLEQNTMCLFLTLCFSVLVFLCGCLNTPFSPVDSAQNTSIRKPNKIKSAYYEMGEMEKLQRVTRAPYTITPYDKFTISVEGVTMPSFKGTGKKLPEKTAVKGGTAPLKAGAVAAAVEDLDLADVKSGNMAALKSELKKAASEKNNAAPNTVKAESGAPVKPVETGAVAHSVVVVPDGSIYIYPVGQIHVAGLTLEEADKLLTRQIREYAKEASITLEPVDLRKDSFTIIGTVNSPGVYTFTEYPTRLSDAIRMAGGVPTVKEDDNVNLELMLADFQNAFLVRKGRILPLDFEKAIIGRDPLYDVPVLNGDYIFIPSQMSSGITVLGEVLKPQVLAYQPNLTLLQAVGFSGGVKETNSSIIRVIRKQGDSSVVYHLDIAEMQQGKSSDFILEPHDIVYVPKDPISTWNVVVRQLLPSAQFLVTLSGPFGLPSSWIYR